ncbi:hypothetical protein JTB14_015448, partial [Gonioctena quinquepunctata]
LVFAPLDLCRTVGVSTWINWNSKSDMTSIAACLIPEDKGQLKAELQNLRRKGALKPSADWDIPGQDPDRSCGRCRVELGRVINRGAYCRACRLKVCKGCREYSLRTTDWVCTVCHKQM